MIERMPYAPNHRQNPSFHREIEQYPGRVVHHPAWLSLSLHQYSAYQLVTLCTTARLAAHHNDSALSQAPPPPASSGGGKLQLLTTACRSQSLDKADLAGAPYVGCA
ncbi:hypothetical protein ABZP36_017508 [Zizania latifolia]